MGECSKFAKWDYPIKISWFCMIENFVIKISLIKPTFLRHCDTMLFCRLKGHQNGHIRLGELSI